MIAQIDFQTTEPVRTALAAVGRTEDLRFSPDNRLLVLAGFSRNRCLILRIHVELTAAGPRVAADDFMEVTSDSIGAVHGVDFIDDKTMAIANRDGLVAIIEVPSGELAGRSCQVDARRQVRGGLFSKLKSPGSVAVQHEPNGQVSLLVCNNYIHQVTRHVIDPRSRYRVRKNQILLKRGLNIPDGIALSHDGQWIAVSSHGTHDIKIFATSGPLGPDAEPVGILQNANYPHGLRFTPDDRHILVADAGAPLIHVYDQGGGWAGPRDPARSVVVLDDKTFLRGHTNIEEGGPKGLDIDRSNNVVAVTCEERALAFFSLASFTVNQHQASFATSTAP